MNDFEIVCGIKVALNTEENGFNLIDVARHAHQAELKLACLVLYVHDNPDVSAKDLINRIKKD